MSNINPTPYTAEELYPLAEKMVSRLHVPDKWVDDAVQEFVIAAWQAGEKPKPDPRAYQIAMGKGAIQHFIRHEAMMENLGPGTCSRHAARVSFDMPVEGMVGEPATLAETIVDESVPSPDVAMLLNERDADVCVALENLGQDHRYAARAIWGEGKTQGEVAETLGKSRQEVRTLLTEAGPPLCEMLQRYESEFSRCCRK